MSRWAYCRKCGSGMARISFQEVKEAHSSHCQVVCQNCGEDRYDDDDEERLAVLLDFVDEIWERLGAVERLVQP